MRTRAPSRRKTKKAGKRKPKKTGPKGKPFPLSIPGRHLSILARVKGKTINVLSTMVVESDLVRSRIPTGNLIAQVSANRKVVWLDSYVYDRYEYGVARPQQRGHSERLAKKGTLVSLKVPIIGNQLPKDLAIQLFLTRRKASREIGNLDELLGTPRSRPKELQAQGKITVPQLAKHDFFGAMLRKSGLTVPGMRWPRPRPKPLPDSLKHLKTRTPKRSK